MYKEPVIAQQDATINSLKFWTLQIQSKCVTCSSKTIFNKRTTILYPFPYRTKAKGSSIIKGTSHGITLT